MLLLSLLLLLLFIVAATVAVDVVGLDDVVGGVAVNVAGGVAAAVAAVAVVHLLLLIRMPAVVLSKCVDSPLMMFRCTSLMVRSSAIYGIAHLFRRGDQEACSPSAAAYPYASCSAIKVC